MKRIAALVLCLLLLMTAVLPTMASASAKTDAVVEQIKYCYKRTLRASGMSSLNGYCGFMAAYQLYILGVERYINSANGNQMYNLYCYNELSSGGFKIDAYPATEYSLYEALYTATNGGTQDVYNILAGFHWTNTSAGRYYGHAVLIHAILDGIVYFTEGFATPMGRAGAPMVATMEAFSQYYNSWTRFEGVIVFGHKQEADFCKEYATDLFVKYEEDVPAYTQPVENREETQPGRLIAAGERIRVSGLFITPEGKPYYRTSYNGEKLYLPAENAEVYRINNENVTLESAPLPDTYGPDQVPVINGTVFAKDSMILSVEAAVTDQDGRVWASNSVAFNSRLAALSNFGVDLSQVEAGAYTYELYAMVANYYMEDGQLQVKEEKVLLYSAALQRGETDQILPGTPEEMVPDGWQWEGDGWSYYKDGQRRTGWICEDGINYYLDENGKTVNGWHNINGKDRFFSDNGAMQVGWLRTDAGWIYLLSNGVRTPEGVREVDGKQYFFNADATVKTSGWAEDDGYWYYLLEDGTFATGWHSLPEGELFFAENGILTAKQVGEGTDVTIEFIPQGAK